MKITLVAKTGIMEFPDSIQDTTFTFWDSSTEGIRGKDADRLAHFAGRSCYESWNMPNPATATDEGYMANIIKQGHFSILEHASATFYVAGVSRNMTHELVRHRHLSYSELSQRYIDMEDALITVPPAIDSYEDTCTVGAVMRESLYAYSQLVESLKAQGITGKKAREAARVVLPGGTETKIVVTGNHRAWRDMLHKRYSVHADAEIREFATEILRQLREIAPAIYQDFPEEPFK